MFLTNQKKLTAIVLLIFILAGILFSPLLFLYPQSAGAAIPAARRAFNTQSNHVGPVVHSSGNIPAYCLDHGKASPDGRTLTRGTKLSRDAGSLGRSISIALDYGPRTTTGGTTINGITLTNLQWRMAVQLAVFRLQGERLAYSTNTDHWRASTWIMNRALNPSTVQLNRYWRYNAPAGSNIQQMVFSQGDPLTAGVRVQKIDAQNGAPLNGASFGMWTTRAAAVTGTLSGANYIGSTTSSGAGSAWWYRVPVGQTYYIREINAPSGYLLNPSVLSVTPIAGDDSEVGHTALPAIFAGTITNEPEARGRIELTKRSISPGNQLPEESIVGNLAYSLAGARYGVWTSRSAADAKNSTHTSYVGQMVTSTSGIASIGNLRMGTYYVREIVPPPGHVLDATTHEVRLQSAGTNTPITARINSSDARRYGTGLVIQKVDRETGQSIAGSGASLAGAEFEIRWHDPSAETDIQNEHWMTQIVVTDSKGRAEYHANGVTKPGIPIGELQVREVKPPKGYLIDPEFSNWRSFKVPESESAERPIEISLFDTVPKVNEPIIRGDIAISKYGGPANETGAPLQGIHFEIIDNSICNADGHNNPRYGQTVGTLITDRDGYADSRELIPPSESWGNKDYSSGFLEYGDYLLSEVASTTPENLEIIDDMKFSVDENGVMRRYSIYNREITAAISIVKRDAETGQVIPLAGTTFQILDKDMQVISFTLNYPKLETIDTFITDDSGQINLPEQLKYGTYYLKELKAPEGYLLLDDAMQFKVEKTHDWNNPLIVSLDNLPAMGRVKIEKADSITGAPVAETVFELRASSDIVTNDGSLRLRAGELADILTSDNAGIAESILLHLGDYELTEVATTPAYLTKKEKFPVSLKYKDHKTNVVWTSLQVENEPVQTSCEVSKKTIDVTSAGYRSIQGGADINNSAQGNKELYRYDVSFKSTSNDWADEFVVIDYLDGVNDGQIRIEELWTPIVTDDNDGQFHLWYQTNLSNESTTHANSSASDNNPYNPANPNNEMRFSNVGWQLWLEGADTSSRHHLKVSDLNLADGEYITGLKLEYGRVEKGFGSITDAPFSYLVYCPVPIEKIDSLTGEEAIIHNTASSHITRNLNLIDDDYATVTTKLIDSFLTENTDRNTEESETSNSFNVSSRESNLLSIDELERDDVISKSTTRTDKGETGPKTGDYSDYAVLIALAAASAVAVLCAGIELLIRRKERQG